MPNTYKLISSVTVGAGGAADITFSSIPNTFTDLLLKLSLRTNQTARDKYATLQFNSSSSNWSYRSIRGLTSGTVSSASDTVNFISYVPGSDFDANTFGTIDVYVPNYNASVNKSLSIDGAQERNSNDMWLNLVASLWANTAAITSIKILPDAGSFVQYSTAYLYGIKNS